MTKPATQSSLYERVGGAPALHAAVDVFYERILADPLLADFFGAVSMPRLKAHQFAILSQALGGPREYSGASMQAAHKRLAIEQHHFKAVPEHLVETLKFLSVPDGIIVDIGAAIARLA